MLKLPPNLWCVDFEFSGTTEGNPPTPICCVARELNSGQTFHLWQDELATCPYGTGADDALIAYSASAELSCHLALHWPIPVNVIDLYAEYRLAVNTAPIKGEPPPPSKLTDALDHFGIEYTTDPVYKKNMQERCSRGAPWVDGEREEILAYCESDITHLPALLEKLLPEMHLGQALERGNFAKVAAAMEFTGIPMDVPKHDELMRKRKLVIAKLIEGVASASKVYLGTTLKLDKFKEWLDAESIDDWPATPSGRPVLSTKALERELADHPQMREFFALKDQIALLRKADLRIGADGYARTGFLPFTAATGRNAPGGAKYIYALPKWMRFLIKPKLGTAIAQLDWKGQEIGIAASKSGDANLMAVYKSGDAHEKAGRLFDLILDDDDEATVRAKRSIVKTVMFGTNYGAGTARIATSAKISHQEAHRLRNAHKRIFADFWAWIEGIKADAFDAGRIETGFGWAMKVPSETRPTTLMDWPMQSIGNEMMRKACVGAYEAGITLCASVHDALVVMAPSDQIRSAVARTIKIMNKASVETVGFKCGVSFEIFSYPERFVEEKGAKMQATVERILDELKDIEPPPPRAKRAPKVMKMGDGKKLHPYTAAVIKSAEKRIETDEDAGRALFIAATDAVKRANGHCIPDIDSTLKSMMGIAEAAGVSPDEAKSIVRSAKRTDEIIGEPTDMDIRVNLINKHSKVSTDVTKSIKKGLIHG